MNTTRYSIHDPPNRVRLFPSSQAYLLGSENDSSDHACAFQGTEDVKFHSLFTDEGHKDADGHPTTWQAIQIAETPLEFFNE